MELSEEQIESLQKNLQALEVSLPGEIAQAKKASAPVELDQTAFGRVSRIDAIQQQQMQAAAVRRMEQRLEQVKEALKRLETDDYGYCGVCEEPISFERLKAQPESRICIACARKS